MPDSETPQQQPWTELRTLRRDELALTLAEMSAKTGYSISYLSNLETGWRQPGPLVIARIAKRLAVTPDSIRPGSGKKSKRRAA